MPSPRDLVQGAREFLEHHGLVAVQPPLRASMYQTAVTDPFRFYLCHRLGIVSPFALSSALQVGSWFHARAEMVPRSIGPELTPEQSAKMSQMWDAREAELKVIARHLLLSPEGQMRLLHEERKDFDLAMATSDVGFYRLQVPGQPPGTTVHTYLRGPNFKLLATEERLSFTYKAGEIKAPCLFTPDALLFNPSTKTLWCIDYKTCSESPTLRLQTCSVEHQTLMYLHGLSLLLESGVLHQKYQLPRDTTLGGMIHIAFQKPGIRLSGEDRDFELEVKVMKAGPRKGQEVTEKKFYGEPRYENYIERVTHWLKGTGPYEHERANREQSPPVNMSTVFYDRIDGSRWSRYHARMSYVARLAMMDPVPGYFPDNPSSLRGMGGTLSPYLPFYTEPVERWPEIVARDFIVKHRDEDVLESAHDRELEPSVPLD
jgi:hypothetical protein